MPRPDALLERVRQAFLAGCEAVQANYQPDPDPDFTEASYDYAASLDFTEDTRPSQHAPTPTPEGEREALRDAAEALRPFAADHKRWLADEEYVGGLLTIGDFNTACEALSKADQVLARRVG